MHVTIFASDLSAIKSDLRSAHPDLQASSRIEAAARGLGFQTYAGLRAALQSGPVDVVANDVSYREYLALPAETEHGRSVRPLGRAVARIELRKVLNEKANLTCRGFDGLGFDTASERSKSIPERQTMLLKRRDEAYTCDQAADEFELACIYLSRQGRIATINRIDGSYGLKHRAEDLSRQFGLYAHLGEYVSNGMLIAAAYALGFNVKPVGYFNYNACLNISRKTVKMTYLKDAHSMRLNGPHVKKLYSDGTRNSSA